MDPRFSDHIKDREFGKFDFKNGRYVVNTQMPSVNSTSYGELTTVGRQVLFDLKANVPSVSQIRNDITTTGTAAVTIGGGEYRLSASAGSKVTFESAERGRYVPGYEAQAGIGVRLPEQVFTGSSYFEWGYFQGQAGLGFGKDATGVYVFTKKNFVKEKIYQQNWNADRLDGTGPSGINLDLASGLIFQIDFSWYGYGSVTFKVQIKSENPLIGDFEQKVHRYAPEGLVSIEQPNLHISAELNNDSDSELEAYVGGRQFSIYGGSRPQFRSVGDYRFTIPITNNWTHIMSFRRKSASLEQLAQSVRIRSSTVVSPDAVVFGYVYNANIVGGTWATPSLYSPGETVLEVNKSATSFSGGILVGPKTVVASGSGNSRTLSRDENFSFDMIEDKPISLVAISANATTTLESAAFNLTEEW